MKLDKNILQEVEPIAIAITSAAVANYVITGAYVGIKIYKDYLSKAARTCKNLEGLIKNECMILAKIKAVEVQKVHLIKAKKLCDKASLDKKIIRCRKRLDKTIEKLDRKKYDLKGDLKFVREKLNKKKGGN